MTDLELLNDLSSELERLTADPGNQNNFLKNFVMMPKQSGVVTVRLLPPLEGKKFPYCATRTHKLNDRNIHCPRELQSGKWLGKCPICEYYTWLWQQSDKNASDAEALRSEARGIRPLERYYYNVVVRDNNETGQGEKDGPLILSVGKILHTKIILGICGNKDFGEEPLGKVWDVETGRDFKIIKKVKPGGQYPEYSDSKFLGVSVLSSNATSVKNWEKGCHDIYALRKLLDEAELKKALRIYKGLEKDPRSSFDPSEFMAPSQGVKVETTVSAKPEKVVTPVSAPSSADLDDEMSLVDSDFIKELSSKNLHDGV